MNKMVLAACAAALLAGCTAQSYARLAPVSDAEVIALSCELIDAEMIRARGFLDEVRQGEKPWWAATAHLADFGAGNTQERARAARSARARLAQLRQARESLACPAPYAPGV